MKSSSIAFRVCSVLLILSWCGGAESGTFAAPRQAPAEVWLNLDGVDLRDVLTFFARKLEVALVLEEGTPQSRPVTLATGSGSLTETLDAVVESAGFKCTRDGGAILVTTSRLGPKSAPAGSGFPLLEGAQPFNVDIRAVNLDAMLAFLEKRFGAHFVLDASVPQPVFVTCIAKAKPWTETLDRVLRANGLAALREGDTYRIVPASAPPAPAVKRVAWIAAQDAQMTEILPPAYDRRDDEYRAAKQAAQREGRAEPDPLRSLLVGELAVTGIVVMGREAGVFVQTSPEGQTIQARRSPKSQTFFVALGTRLYDGDLKRVEAARNGGVPFAVFTERHSFRAGERSVDEENEVTKVVTRAAPWISR